MEKEIKKNPLQWIFLSKKEKERRLEIEEVLGQAGFVPFTESGDRNKAVFAMSPYFVIYDYVKNTLSYGFIERLSSFSTEIHYFDTADEMFAYAQGELDVARQLLDQAQAARDKMNEVVAKANIRL